MLYSNTHTLNLYNKSKNRKTVFDTAGNLFLMLFLDREGLHFIILVMGDVYVMGLLFRLFGFSWKLSLFFISFNLEGTKVFISYYSVGCMGFGIMLTFHHVNVKKKHLLRNFET